MERVVVKGENNILMSGSYSSMFNNNQSGFSLFDSPSDHQLQLLDPHNNNTTISSSLGFMDILGINEDLMPTTTTTPLFDMVQQQQQEVTPSIVQVVQEFEDHDGVDYLDAMDDGHGCNMEEEGAGGGQPPLLPATPNSASSTSSASSEALNDHVEAHGPTFGGLPTANETTCVTLDHDQNELPKTKKVLIMKTKKTSSSSKQKRQREPRFAFMTKSEVDHLEDGYRWRKYGQKAVKNSPFPRSYYRCTTASCNVKKRVERSYSDPSMVVTTYEGQHTHPSPVTSRSCYIAGAGIMLPLPDSTHPASSATTFGGTPYHQAPMYNGFPSSNLAHCNPNTFANGNAGFLHDQRRSCNIQGAALLQDHGLLQDIVPSYMLKEE